MSSDEMNKIIQEQRETDYTHWLIDVIDWNKAAENGVEPSLEKQIMFVREEVDELFEAYDKGDVEAFYKELADCFVTSGYAANIKWRNREACVMYSNSVEYLLGVLEDAVIDDPTITTFSIILDIMNSLNQEKVVRYLNATLRSNWSKFFTSDVDREVEIAKEKYKGRYEGIHVVKDIYGTYCLKDKHNKVLKPSTFKDYKEYL